MENFYASAALLKLLNIRQERLSHVRRPAYRQPSWSSTIRSAPVLMFAAMAGLFAERSGVIDLALEGKILASAFASAAVAFATQNVWYGIAAGTAVSAALALVQGYVSISQKGNQLVAGMAINIAISGLTFVLAQFFFQQGGRTPDLGDARLFRTSSCPAPPRFGRHVPFLGWFYGHLIGGHSVLVYMAFAVDTAGALGAVSQPLRLAPARLRREPARRRCRRRQRRKRPAIRRHAHRRRILCSFSGAYLAIVQSGFFLRDMSAGAGYLALDRPCLRQLAPALHGAGLPHVRLSSAPCRFRWKASNCRASGRIPGCADPYDSVCGHRDRAGRPDGQVDCSQGDRQALRQIPIVW